MKFRHLLTTSRSALLAGAVLVTMAASADTVFEDAPTQFGNEKIPDTNVRYANVLSLEVAGDGLRHGEAAPFSNLPASSAAPLSTVAGSDSTGRLPLAPAPAVAEPSDPAKLWTEVAIVRRFEANTPARWDAALRAHSLGSEGDPDGFMAGIFMAENGSPDYLFSVTTAGYLDGLSLQGMVPVPEPTTALFGLALVGFCALARYGPRTKAEQKQN